MDILRMVIETIGGVLYQVLLQLRAVTGNFGLAIILLTITIRVALFPLVRHQLTSTKRIRALAPQVAALRERFRDNPRQLSIELAGLYRSNGIRPVVSFFAALPQLPILAGLWAALRRPHADRFLGIPLDATPNLPSILLHPTWVFVPLLVGLATYWQQQVNASDPHQVWILIAMAAAVGYFAMQFPVGMSVYWITSSLASVAEHYLVVGRRPSVASITPQMPKRLRDPRKKRRR